MLGIAVSLFILLAAVGIVREAAGPLMGEAPDARTVKRINDLVVASAPLVLNVHHVHIHRYGDHTEVTLHAIMPGDTTLDRAHEVSSVVEDRIRAELGMEATVHAEPGGVRAP